MADERRNLYRVLHVQPEAPVEIIKASYRTLMSALRAHPDLGGSTDHAAQLNTAYETLCDPARRQAYDRSLKTPPRTTADGAARPAARGCSFCGAPLTLFQLTRDDPRCPGCDSPLAPAPAGDGSGAELLGRRGGPRFARDQALRIHLPGGASQPARLRDLSLTGLQFTCALRVPKGAVLRVVGPSFDCVALVVASRGGGDGWRVHARMLTLQLVREARGVFVSAKV